MLMVIVIIAHLFGKTHHWCTITNLRDVKQPKTENCVIICSLSSKWKVERRKFLSQQNISGASQYSSEYLKKMVTCLKYKKKQKNGVTHISVSHQDPKATN